MKKINNKSVIFFDGYCNLCNASVRFIIKRDKKHKYVFSSLQSDVAKHLLLQYKYNILENDSIILIEGEKVYDKSTATLRIAKNLSQFWNYTYFFIYLPKLIRDYIYDFIAKNRYKWFGKQEKCTTDSLLSNDRFL